MRVTVSATPRLRVEAACEQLGRAPFRERCRNLLAGGTDDPGFIETLGGVPAMHLLNAGIPPGQDYWLRVWAGRGLLWAGAGPEDEASLRAALADPAWRVREMACKVVARHRLGELLDDVATLQEDANARVRAAARRAVVNIVDADA
jgi:hypothetical protein